MRRPLGSSQPHSPPRAPYQTSSLSSTRAEPHSPSSHDAEEDEVYELTLEKLIKGFELWVAGGYDTYGAVCEGVVDTGEIDAEKADQICQLALFGEIIFG